MNIQISEIKTASTKALVETYNNITGKSIKKFRDRITAERQVAVALAGVEVKIPKKTNPTGKRASYESRTIEVLVKENPKKEGSRAYKKFAVLMKMHGKSIAELKAQEDKHPELDTEKGWPATELRWAIKLGLVKLVISQQIAA